MADENSRTGKGNGYDIKISFFRNWFDIASLIPTRAERLAFLEGLLATLFDADASNELKSAKVRLLMESALRRIGKRLPPSTSTPTF